METNTTDNKHLHTKKTFWKDKKNIAIVVLSILLFVTIISYPTSDTSTNNLQNSNLTSTINELQSELEEKQIEITNLQNSNKSLTEEKEKLEDEKKELIGALCVNIDTTKAVAMLQLFNNWANGKPSAASLSSLASEAKMQIDPGTATESKESVKQFVKSMIDTMVHELVVEGRNSKEDRLDLIRFMDERGVFLVKGSMEYVAGKLGLSKVTLYGYLDQIHGKR